MVKRVLLGRFPDGGFGLRVSQAGYDVTSNPVDNEKLIFNSDWPGILPIYATGYMNLSADSTTTASYTDMGYIPFCSALVNVGRGWEQLSMSTALQSKTLPANNPIATPVDASPAYQYAWSGGRYTTFNIRTFSNSIVVYCSEAIQVKWTVYRLRAF
jgi:hypothetical protein